MSPKPGTLLALLAGSGRPRTKLDIEQIIVRLASDNPGWGYTRIQGALMNLDIKVGRATIRRILKDNLIEPAPTRGQRMSWSTFLKAHWRGLAASDFFTVEVWSGKGLLTVYVLFVIDLATRRVNICGLTTHPNDLWMLQISRNLFDRETGALRDKRHLIVDRDTKYSRQFRTFCAREGVKVIRLSPRSPNLNAYAKRFIRSIKEECVSKLIPIGTAMLRRSLQEYVEHYHLERNHQGLDNQLLVPRPAPHARKSQVNRRTRLGGLLNFYERAAA